MKHMRIDYDGIQDSTGKVPDDEPVFLLRGKDPSAAAAVNAWANDVQKRGGDPELVASARQWAMQMAYYQMGFWNDGHHVADVPEGMLR